MINPKLYKEIIRQHLDIPDPEFQIVISFGIMKVDGIIEYRRWFKWVNILKPNMIIKHGIKY